VTAAHTPLLAVVLFCVGCAVHSPERAAREFVRQIRRPSPATGSSSFDKLSHGLQLQEEVSKKGAYRRSAAWVRKKDRIALVTSNVLQDDPLRYDLRLSWAPSRLLGDGLPDRLLGPPSGLSATGDSAWVLPGGGVLEYRHAGIDTPYLLYSSSGYIREPLDFVEAVDGAKLPPLAGATQRLQELAGQDATERTEMGFRSRRSCFSAGTCVTLYVSSIRQQPDYLMGLGVTVGGASGNEVFVRLLREFNVPDAENLVEAVAVRPLAVKGNFAVARDGPYTLTVWRRIESPVGWCKYLRPDLERCK
jgi:hypothetical protein